MRAGQARRRRIGGRMQCTGGLAEGGGEHPIAQHLHCRYGESRLERTADAAQGRARVRVLRLERRRRGRHDECAVPAPAAGGDAVLRARPRRVLRFPGGPPDRLARRRRRAAAVVARELVRLRGAPERQRHRGDGRHRAAEPLEALLAQRRRGGARERRRARRHARRLPGRHAAHPPGARDRLGRRRARRPARPRTVGLRGPDRHRRRHPRRLQGGRHRRRRACGRPSRTTSRSRPTRRRRSRCSRASRCCWTRTST